MDNLIVYIVISFILFSAFVFSLVLGLIKQKRSLLFIVVFFFIACIISGTWAGYLFAYKAYDKMKTISIENPFRPRTGIEIYLALFGKPKMNCVEVKNKTDQLVPRLDCCIWLEFKTCTEELRRIIALENYTKNQFPASDTNSYMPGYSPRPEWFKPGILGDTIFVLQAYNPDNPNWDQILIFSTDSSHAFYCDMAD